MKIVFIQTGGTIDKDYPRKTGGYAFEIDEPAVERILSMVNPTFVYEVLTVCRKDSQDITDQDRHELLETVHKVSADRIVITHGTDTMLDTAEFLDGSTHKVIVITGAMKPERFIASDAAFNVGVALGAAASLQPGVYIAMNGTVLPWHDCRRDGKTGQFIRRV